GPLIAVPQPMRNVKVSSVQGVSSPSHAANESDAETISMKICAASITRRRSRLSATAPAQSDSRTIGRLIDAWTRAIIWGDAPMLAIVHDAPTDWISPPKLEARLANQIARKSGMRKGEGGAEGSIPAQCRSAPRDPITFPP